MLFRQSGRSLVVHTPAKLNLFLEVLGKRPDGFHELETLMVSVGLYDTLSFTEEPNRTIQLRCFDAGYTSRTDVTDDYTIPGGRNNLVVQAAQLLREQTGVDRGIHIDLVKRIPVASGLAGGSSDAAATLAALNRLWDLKLTTVELQDLASRLGSDVGFFLAPMAAAVCRGRGERIEPIQLSRCLNFVIARPRTGLSTATVYRHCRPSENPLRADDLIDSLNNASLACAAGLLCNSLQTPAEELNHEVKQLKSYFSSQSVLGHMMSGSGTAYFGLCANRRQAESVAARLRAKRVGRVYVAQSRP